VPEVAGPAGPATAHPARRRVTSFVHQRNRFTEGQAHAWERLWPVYGRDVADVVSGAAAYDPPAWFGRRAPLVLEIGPGPGSRPPRRPPRLPRPTTSPSRSSNRGSPSC